MTKLNDMQLVLLTAACQREDGSLLPAPESLGNQTARIRKAIESLIKKGLLAEKEGLDAAQVWRTDGDVSIGVIVTDVGRAIINPPTAPDEGNEGGSEQSTSEAPPASTRPATKRALVIDLLKREGGTTLAGIVEATGWLPHTSRAALTGLRKKGHDIASTKVEGITRYQIKATA